MEAEALRVRDNPDANRYEATIDGEIVGRIDYRLEPGVISLLHAEVEPSLQGRGLGSVLVARTLEDIRGRALSVVPVCGFVRAYIDRVGTYADLVRSR